MPGLTQSGHEFTVFKGTKAGNVVRSTTKKDELTADQVLVNITHSGLCGTDLHYRAAGCVLGHEGAGVVEKVGPDVASLKPGDRVGWGYLQNSCSHCKQCDIGQQVYCPNREVYGFHNLDQGSLGYASVWSERFLFKVPEGISNAEAAPLMCAGATAFSIFDQFNIKPTDRVGILGLGGVGHVAVQMSHHMGCQTVVFSGSENKRQEATELGADEFYATKGVSELKDIEPIDHLIVTTSSLVDWSLYLPIMAPRGTVYPLTVAFDDFKIPYAPLIGNGLRVVGSLVAPPAVHKRMLAFSAKHKIKPVIQEYTMDEPGIETAMNDLTSGDVRYRAVLTVPQN